MTFTGKNIINTICFKSYLSSPYKEIKIGGKTEKIATAVKRIYRSVDLSELAVSNSG